MGCASSCRTFEMFSTAIEWVARTKLSMPHLIHILDDYLMAAPTFHQCRINLDRFLSLCAYLAVPMAPENVLSFLCSCLICRSSRSLGWGMSPLPKVTCAVVITPTFC